MSEEDKSGPKQIKRAIYTGFRSGVRTDRWNPLGPQHTTGAFMSKVFGVPKMDGESRPYLGRQAVNTPQFKSYS